MFKKLLSVVLIGVMALSLAGFNWFGGGANKASNYSDADFKDYCYCYVDGSGVLHFTSDEKKGKYCYSSEYCETGANFGDINTHLWVSGVPERNKIKEVTFDDKVLVKFGHFFSNFSELEKINNIKNLVLINMESLFMDCYKLESLDLSSMDTSMVGNMEYAFCRCTNLKSLDVSTWNTSRVKNMNDMFWDCNNLEKINVGNWDVSSVTSMYEMFRECEKLSTLDIGKWDVSNVITMSYMFDGCKKLGNLDIGKWNIINVEHIDGMFCHCSSLISLDINNWNVKKVKPEDKAYYDHTVFWDCNDSIIPKWYDMENSCVKADYK